MIFKQCVLCGDEKTIKQFSKRITDVCTSCMMTSSERTKNRKPSTPYIRESLSKSIPTASCAVKVAPATKKLINPMGYRVVDPTKPTKPTKPTVRVGSTTYSKMSEEQRREVLKAEYRIRQLNKHREKLKISY